ncbi:ankyrin repeat-containing domain protein, partial [Haematococcus lacustris]
YIYSLYFAMAAFTGLGDNDFYIASVPEAVVMLVYLLFNLLLGAYILGTVTMLLTKGDKRMKLFRDRVMNLRSYGVINTLPQRLMTAMEAHVELHFQSEQASDEQVLAIFPQTIRRRVLRHLYIKPIKECHLFAGCKPKYLDAVLAAGRVELFMPQEQIIADGDIVNEIWVLLEGEVEVCRGGTAPAHLRYGHKPASSTRDGMTKALMSRNRSKSTAGREQEQQGDAQGKGGGSRDQADMLHSFARQSMERGSGGNVSRNSSLARSSSMNGSECGSDHGSMGTEGSGGHDQSRGAAWGQANNDSAGSLYTRLAPGAAFGETSFFTELPSQESVWSSSVIKVLVLNRTAYQELLTTFPQQTRKVLQNLEVHNDELVTNMLLGSLTASKNMSEEVAQALHLLAIRDVGPSELTAGVLMEMRGLLKPHQRPMLDDMGKVKDALAKYVRKVDQEIVYEFLNNCSAGDEAAVRAALSGGMSPNAADYDKRTGLMLACHEGHAGLVRMLLEAGADPQLKDSFGGTAMWECVKNSRDGIIEILLEFGGSLGMEGFLVSSHLSQGVCDGDLVQVSRMIRAGANLNVPDYSGMTPLHVAVLSGNLPAVQLLVNEGAAKVDYKDTLGFTPYEEAVRLKNQPIADFLKAITEKAVSDAADLVRNMDFLNFCSSGNESMVRQMLKAGQDPDTADYDVRTGLMLACHEGHEAIVRLLLVNGADPMKKDNFGNTAMWEAVLNKRHAIIDLMLEFGGGLGMEGVALSATMSRLILEQDLPVLHSLLKAKADPDTEDYVCQVPLHVAALLGNLQAVRLLVEDANACVDPVDLHGRTPLDCARTRSHWQVVEYLEPLTQAAAQGQIKNRNNSCAPPACSLLLGQPRVIIPPKPASVPHPRDCPSQPPGLPDIPCASPASLTSADQASPFSLATRDTELVLSPKPGGAAHPSLPPTRDPDSGFMLTPTLVTSFTSTTPSQLRKHPLAPQPGPCKPSTMPSFTSSITSAFTSITSRHRNAECDPRVPAPTSTSTSLHAALGTGQLPSKFKPSVDLTPRNPSCTSPLSPFLGPGSFVLSPFVGSTSRGPASVTAVATGQGRQVPGKVTSKASFTAAGNGGGGANMAAMLRMRRSLAMEMGPGATGAAVDSQGLGSRTEGELSGFEYWGGPASPPPAPTALMTEQRGMRQRVQDLVPHRASGGSGNCASTPRLHRVPGAGGGRQDAGPSAATISGAGQWHALPGGLAMPPVLEVAGSSEEGEGSRDPSRRPAKGARNPLTDPLSQLNNGDEPED